MKYVASLLIASLVAVSCNKSHEESGLDEFQKSSINKFGLAGTKKLALTFDDGPSDHTDALLDYLEQLDVKATFFINGANVAKESDTVRQKRLATLKRMHDEGHIVANHTHEHRHVGNGISTTELMRQVSATHEVIKDYVGLHRLYFRAPYGAWAANNAGVLNRDEALSAYIGPVFWDIGGEIRYRNGQLVGAADWDCWGKKLSVAKCADGYLTDVRAQKGGVVLMHDITANTVSMVKSMLQTLVNEGYSFITLDEVEALDAFGAAPNPAPRDPEPTETPKPSDDVVVAEPTPAPTPTEPTPAPQPQEPAPAPSVGLAFLTPTPNQKVSGKTTIEVTDGKQQATAVNFYVRKAGTSYWSKLGTAWNKPFKLDWWVPKTPGDYEIKAESWNRSTKLEEAFLKVSL